MRVFTPEQEQYFISGIKNRDEVIFADFYRQTRPLIAKILFTKYPYRMSADIDDVLQEFYLKVWNKINLFQGRSQFITWLYRVAFNVVIDKVVKNKHYNHCNSLDLLLEEGKDFEYQRPLDKNEKLSNEIAELKNCLGENHLVVFKMVFEQGKTFQETAKILDIPMGTVQSRSHYLKQKLKKKLKI